MIIQMILQMSGGRYDDRSWPPPWTDFEVPDEEGRGLIDSGVAAWVADRAVPVKPAPVTKSATETVALTAKAAGSATETTALAAQPAEPATAVKPVTHVNVPVPADPKAAWVEYAVSRGAAQAEAEAMTKSQLQIAYGGRL
jgi:hypothetical protein